MKKKKKDLRPLSTKMVGELKKYREPSFDLILDFLIKEKFMVDCSDTLVAKMYTKIDNFYWKADRKLLRSDGKDFITGHNVMHHGMHYLVNRKFPVLKGRPMMTLWAESIASASNVYFAATYFNLWGAGHPFSSHMLQELKSASEKLGRSFMQPFKDSVEDPWLAFKQSTAEIFQFVHCIWELALQPEIEIDDFNARTLKLSKSSQYFCYISIFDYTVFTYYALRNCGEKSIASDLADLKKANEILTKSHSMVDFLTRLGIKGPKAI